MISSTNLILHLPFWLLLPFAYEISVHHRLTLSDLFPPSLALVLIHPSHICVVNCFYLCANSCMSLHWKAVANILASSANGWHILSTISGMSLTNITNSVGPRTGPYGIPDLTGTELENSFSTRTRWFLPVRNAPTQEVSLNPSFHGVAAEVELYRMLSQNRCILYQSIDPFLSHRSSFPLYVNRFAIQLRSGTHPCCFLKICCFFPYGWLYCRELSIPLLYIWWK